MRSTELRAEAGPPPPERPTAGPPADFHGPEASEAAAGASTSGPGAPPAAFFALIAAFALAACGGGGGGDGGSEAAATTSAERVSEASAARFLTQASFGPTMAEIGRVAGMGFSAWIEEQFRAAPMDTHWDYVARGGPPGCTVCDSEFINAAMETFWLQAVRGADQLRQRVVFALSEIFVVSTVNSAVETQPEAHASYLDMLGAHCFGNFRQLLEAVARHPTMGHYLSHFRNEKEDPATGRIPDENFAREVMQLFTIGLWELNEDGSRRLDANGNPIPTYGQMEIAGMARVFTGLSWGGADTSNARWRGWPIGGVASVPWDLPMQVYPQFASTSEKPLIRSVVIAQGTSGDESLRIALDTLFNHPNVGPFIGEQLIKRFITSNPSRAYVRRVAQAFNDNGQRVRGDMKAVLRQVFLDPEARDEASLQRSDWGKLREPIVRFGNWLRAFNASAANGKYAIWNLEDPVSSLGQNPLRAPSVFNWFRPDYAPPGPIANQGLVAPEFQITHETTVTGYANFIITTVERGYGYNESAVRGDYTAERALADRPDALLDRLNLLLLAGRMTETTRATIRAAVESYDLANANGAARRVYAAVALTMLSPEFIVQR